MSVTTDPQQAMQFIERIFDSDDVFEFRGFPSDKKRTPPNYNKWFTLGDFGGLNGELSQPMFVGINPRIDYGKAKDDNVKHCRFLFADFDPPKGEVVTVEQAIQRITDAGLPYPDPVVASGRGVHAYWQLAEPIGGDRFKSLQRRLARLLGSDPAVCNAERIMRLPGSIHNKGEPVLVRLVSCIDEFYRLADIEKCLPPDNVQAPSAEPLDDCEVRPLPDWITRTIINGANNGNRNSKAFEIAAHLAGNGWGREDTIRHVTTFAQNCRPPLPIAEVGSTVASAYSAPREPVRNTDSPPPPPGPVDAVSLGKLVMDNPKLSDPVIDGLLRLGETANIIAAPKVGKSWLMYCLAISVATGRRWLDTYQCNAGPVLLIDNELHAQTVADRLPQVARAMGVSIEDLNESIDVLSLRGKGVTLDRLAPYIKRIESGYYKLIVLDAWYRFIPKGSNENSNADVMGLYNLLDEYAEQTGAAMVAVHHTSKGQQGEKSVTDTGAGAGAQSRAADAHIVLRQHEEEGHVVLDAAVRSFKPIDPVPLRWEFPLWHRAEGIDVNALEGRKTRQEAKREKDDAEAKDAIVKALRSGPMTKRELRDKAPVCGKCIGRDRMDRLVTELQHASIIKPTTVTKRGQETSEYSLA